MRTIFFIIVRWLLEVLLVVSLTCVFLAYMYPSGGLDRDLLRQGFYSYIKLSLLVALPWGLFWRAYQLGKGEEMFLAIMTAIGGHTLAVYFFLNPSKSFQLIEWLPYFASLTPLALVGIFWFWKLCVDFDAADKPKKPKKVDLDEEDFQRLMGAIRATLERVEKLEGQVKKLRKQPKKTKRKDNPAE